MKVKGFKKSGIRRYIFHKVHLRESLVFTMKDKLSSEFTWMADCGFSEQSERVYPSSLA